MSYRTGIGGIRRGELLERVRSVVPDGAVEQARSLGRRYGTATASLRPAPDYLVIGAKKGGTTSLANWLQVHPQVTGMVPRWQSAKSCHYFDINYWRGPDWYRSHFASRPARTRQARRLGHRTLTGETSPYYLFHPAAADRIAETLPDVRLIAILREPVARAYSHYWDRRATGHESLTSFEEAVAAEPERLAHLDEASLSDPRHYDYDHDHHTYLARGEYAGQLERYFARFGRESVLVLLQDDLSADSRRVFAQVQTFLGLESRDLALTPRNVREGYPTIDPATRDRLRAAFAPHNDRLERLLGQPLPW